MRYVAHKILVPTVFIGLLLSIGVFGTLYYLSGQIPSPENLVDYKYELPTRIFDRNGELVEEHYINRRVLVPYEKIPPVMINALLSIEDSRFYSHIGVDPIRMAKAAIVDLIKMDFSQGASTLTQQTAKMFLLTSEKKIIRKLKEILLALKIERSFTKEQILEMYLNKAYFGHGAWGIETAAQAYFSKHVENLNLPEAAMLAGMVQAPSRLAPTNSIERATRRRNLVLRQMVESDYITKEEKEIASAQPIELRLGKTSKNTEISYYIEEVRKQLLKTYGADTLYRGGLNVYTAMDLQAQIEAQKSLEMTLNNLDKRRGYRGVIKNIFDKEQQIIPPEAISEVTEKNHFIIGGKAKGVVEQVNSKEAFINLGIYRSRIFLDSIDWARPYDIDTRLTWSNKIRDVRDVLTVGDVIEVEILDYEQESRVFISTLYQKPLNNGGLFSMDPRTGQVLALSGGYDFKDSEYNRAVQSRRQPGSAFKPIVYATALDNSYTTASILEDTPLVFKDLKNQFTWMPSNYNRKFLGKIPLRDALVNSKNVPTVKLLMSLGIEPVIEKAKEMGITSNIPENYSIALGSASATLEEMVGVFSAFANGGDKVTPIYITKIEDRNGKVLQEFQTEKKQVLSPETAYLITSILQDVVNYGTGWRAKQGLNRPSAGKTGTTNGFTDAWYIGYIPQIITGVYVGNDSPERSLGINETGSSAAAPAWVRFMKNVTATLPILPFEQPRGIEMVKINKESGLLACDEGPNQKFEYFKSGTAPTECHTDLNGSSNRPSLPFIKTDETDKPDDTVEEL